MLNLITDRTNADVQRWKELHDKGWDAMTAAEQTEWMNGMKGAYKHTDLNRVESAVEELQGRLIKLGKLDTPLVVKTDWTRTGYPSVADMNRYFSNVESLKVALGVNLNVPSTPSTRERFNYDRANNLEKILVAVDAWVSGTESAINYSGEIYAGEV